MSRDGYEGLEFDAAGAWSNGTLWPIGSMEFAVACAADLFSMDPDWTPSASSPAAGPVVMHAGMNLAVAPWGAASAATPDLAPPGDEPEPDPEEPPAPSPPPFFYWTTFEPADVPGAEGHDGWPQPEQVTHHGPQPLGHWLADMRPRGTSLDLWVHWLVLCDLIEFNSGGAIVFKGP